MARESKRKLEHIRQLKNVYILTEGETEDLYFNHIRDLYTDSIKIKVLKRNGNSPLQLLKQMKKKLKTKEYKLEGDDEAWLVFDHEGRRPDKEYEPLVNWKKESMYYGFAVSNRDFEYWKVLHFHNGNGFRGDHNKYYKELADNLGGMPVDSIKNQNIGEKKLIEYFKPENIQLAIKNAKKRRRDTEEKGEWPKIHFNSFVYLLMEKIVNS